MLAHAVRAELTKALTLRSWWVGVGVVLALTVYFAYINASLLVETAAATWDTGVFRDIDGTSVPVARAVGDAILASPYQSAAFFLPLLIAMMAGQEYRNQQFFLTVAAVPDRRVLFAAKIAAVALLAVGVTIMTSLVNAAVLLALLPSDGDAMVLSATSLEVFAKVALYAVTIGVFAAALTSIVRSTLWALVASVVLYGLTASQLLEAVSPVLHHASPMIGAQTFLFGYAVDPDAPGTAAGVVILLGWLVVAASVWCATLVRRDAA